MVESGPTSVMKKTTSKASTTARASRRCARPGDKLERMKCCSSGTTAAVFTIGGTPRSGWGAGHGARMAFHTLAPGGLSRPQFAPFLPIGPADDEQGSVAASEKPGQARFPAAAHVIAPVTDLRTLL